MPTVFNVGNIEHWRGADLSHEEVLAIVNSRVIQLEERNFKLAQEKHDLLQKVKELTAELAVVKAKSELIDTHIGGCVYIIKTHSGEYKIGKTKNLPTRFSQLKMGLPYSLRFVLSIVTNDMDTLERNLHHRFREKHVSGEWFNLEPSDIRAIRKEYSDWLVELD